VTLGDGIAEERIAAATAALGDYASVATFDRVVLLEEQAGRRWSPVADACLGTPAVIGTGGLSVTITRSRLLDPEARAAMRAEGGDPSATAEAEGVGWDTPDAHGCTVARPIVLTARTEDGVAGVAGAWVDHAGPHAGVLVTRRRRLQGIGGHLLAHLESCARGAGWDFAELRAEGPAAFYESRSAWVRAARGTAAGYSNSTEE
jgi:GNAT superfamily N-acetyltransferase